jgi:putative holliday junction resolvase
MRILAVDPGLKRIGTAISDPTGTVARTLEIIPHRSLGMDAASILALAAQEGAEKILIGSTHIAGTPASPIARFTHRLLAALRKASQLPISLTDESFSTRMAQQARIDRGDGRETRRQADDALAAAALLQEYLDAHRQA